MCARTDCPQRFFSEIMASAPAISLNRTVIPGCYELALRRFDDHRGRFVKISQKSVLTAHGVCADFSESFYSISGERVLRGMHVQLPPSAYGKLVVCLAGSIADVALDLRIGSPAYGRHIMFELNAEQANAVYVPEGVAHGFYVRGAPATVMYQVTAEHDPAADTGIAWDSFGAKWPDLDPIISARDAAFAQFSDFESPFVFGNGR